MERLQKIIAAAGITSRRKAEQLITAGRVAVNGVVVTELGAKADAVRDHIRVEGRLISAAPQKTYVVLNKPKGYVTTVSDPQGRPTVMDLLRGLKSSLRLYPVGRLDWNSEGLLLLTNDGELANQLMRAASHVPKTYLVKVSGKPSEAEIARLRAGVSISDERGRRVKTAPAKIILAREAENPWYEVTLHEGRNRQIRRMFEQVGHHVEKIRRIRYGPLQLDVEPGQHRFLSAAEVAKLRNSLRSTRGGEESRVIQRNTR
jgi:23S rRNA pseudouridine2605 synthase